MQKLYSKEFFSPCPVETTLNLIVSMWKLLIVWDLLKEKRRFGELKKSISASKNQIISQNVLTQNLRELESAGIIKRKVYAEVPPKVEYSLTELGQNLSAVVASLEHFGREYQGHL